MLICKFCEKEVPKLVDAHIIPRAFYEVIKEYNDTEHLLLKTNTPNHYTQKTWIGLYDNNLVCPMCEDLFKVYDDYAIKLLLKTNDFEEIHNEVNNVAWKKKQYDYTKLKIFFLTILWRAGASDKPQFKRVKLGVYLNKLKENIQNKDPGTEHEYSVLLARYDDNDEIGRNLVLDPELEQRKTFDGLNCYKFFLGAGYIAYIKVDKRQFKGVFPSLILSPNNPLYVYNKGNIQNSGYLNLLKDLASK